LILFLLIFLFFILFCAFTNIILFIPLLKLFGCALLVWLTGAHIFNGGVFHPGKMQLRLSAGRGNESFTIFGGIPAVLEYNSGCLLSRGGESLTE
jgi:hypothetical protein